MKNLLFTTVFIIFSLINMSTLCNATNKVHAQQIIDSINQTYNNYPTIKSKFKQIDSLGKEDYGWFILDKKNSKARVEYTSTPLRLIINNSSIMIEQIDLKEKTFSPLITSPLKYIINKDGRLNSSELNINHIITTPNGYEITVNSKQNSIKGNVTLNFNLKYFLVGWIITDELGNKTQISLVKPDYNNNKIPSYVFNTHRVSNINFNNLK